MGGSVLSRKLWRGTIVNLGEAAVSKHKTMPRFAQLKKSNRDEDDDDDDDDARCVSAPPGQPRRPGEPQWPAGRSESGAQTAPLQRRPVSRGLTPAVDDTNSRANTSQAIAPPAHSPTSRARARVSIQEQFLDMAIQERATSSLAVPRPHSVATTVHSQSASQRPWSRASDNTDYSTMLGSDQKDPWSDFKQYMLDRYGNLPAAFDAIDINGNGELSVYEFQNVVHGILRYCRMADARRLFEAGCGNGEYMSWLDFGIRKEEWMQHRMRMKAKTDFLINHGARGRAKEALALHSARIVNKGAQRGDFAFESQLPKGWGFPPDFAAPVSHQSRTRVAPVSAR